MNALYDKAFERIIEVIMFENWLRFYFIAEQEDKIVVTLPEKAIQRIEADYPTLAGLALRLQGEEVDHETSVQAVCMFVAQEIDGTVVPEEIIKKVFDADAFHFELNLFGMWVQNHEQQLDEAFHPFAAWRKLFQEWKTSPQVQEYIASIQDATSRVACNTSEQTQ